MQNPGVLKTHRDSNIDSIFSVGREMRCRDPPCVELAWALRNAKAIGRKYQKPNNHESRE